MKYKLLLMSMATLLLSNIPEVKAQEIDLPVKKISKDDITKTTSQAKDIIGNENVNVNSLQVNSLNPIMNNYIHDNATSNMIKTPAGAPPLPNSDVNEQIHKFNNGKGDGKKEIQKHVGHTKTIGIIKPLDNGIKPPSVFNMGGQPNISTGLNAEQNVGNDAGVFNLSVSIPNLHMAEKSRALNDLTTKLNTPETKTQDNQVSNCHSGDLDELLSPGCLKKINNGSDFLPNVNNPEKTVLSDSKNTTLPLNEKNNIKCHVLIKEAHMIDHFNSNTVEDCIKTALGESEGVSGIINIALQNNDSITVVSCVRDANGLHPLCHQIKR